MDEQVCLGRAGVFGQGVEKGGNSAADTVGP